MKLYERIYRDLRKDIVDKRLKQGERLPSIIALAKRYDCSKGTVIKALELLLSQHVIFSKPQSGYYVADNFLRQQHESGSIYLDTANPLIDSFEIFDIKHCLNLAVELYAKYAIDESVRLKSLHPVLQQQLAADGVYTKLENIHLVQGITQMLVLFTEAPFPNGKKTILIEEPSYSHYIRFLKLSDVPVLTIARDEQGIDLKQLEHFFKHEEIKFFYTTPRNHNPLGTSYSYKQRKKIMELALQYDVYIVEDDYFGGTHKLPQYVPMHYFSYQQNCIYLRSNTKVFPLIRIGLVVIPDDFKKTFEAIAGRRTSHYSYYIPSLISQATWEAYISSAIYEKHIVQKTKQIDEKLQAVSAVTADWQPELVKVIGARSGYYFTLRIHPKIMVKTVIENLKRKDIFIASNEQAFYHQEHFDNSVRVSVSRVSLEQLKQALGYIYQEVERLADGTIPV